VCNRYQSPSNTEIEDQWGISQSIPWESTGVYPRGNGIFIRLGESGLESVIGRWGLIPPFAKTADIRYSTNNARSEEVSSKPSYRDAWKKGQRCIIPASSFDEPCWETGKNVWHTFTRKDRLCWGLAGLWNTWLDRVTGEIVESYTMLTVNADHHPVMSRMHKPDADLPPNAQDKRSVISVEQRDVKLWLEGELSVISGLLVPPAPAQLVF
jgi:putative SOS response-associated peptidase YedK